MLAHVIDKQRPIKLDRDANPTTKTFVAALKNVWNTILSWSVKSGTYVESALSNIIFTIYT